MSGFCLLDQLPVELLNHLFTYFRAKDIFSSFVNISDYINAAIVSYMAYQSDFRTIRDIYFDTICRHIRPERVKSLVLFDDDDTPGQSKLFFSRFSIEQFTRLRSLTLVKIEFESLKYILSNLDKLNPLCSISFEDKVFKCRNDEQKNEISQLFATNDSQIRYRLRRLYLKGDIYVPILPYSHFRHLKFVKYSNADLQSYFYHSPQLTSFCLNLNSVSLYDQTFTSPKSLTRLSLKVQRE